MGCVIVLGLPRGGTSAVAGVVHHLGVNMGDELMPAFHVNPKGFYEDMPFVDYHNRLLGGRDKDPREEFLLPPGDGAWVGYTALIQTKARQRLWGVKDPKMCFMLPHFLARLDVPAKVVLVRRRFHDTVHSYEQLWGGVPRDEAVRRLGHYQYALSKNLEGLKVPLNVVQYEGLCRNPDLHVRDLADFLEVEYREEAARFIDPALNRNGDIRKSGVTALGG